METVYVSKVLDVRRKLKQLEARLGVKITLVGKKVTIDGNSLNEYDALKVFEAINFGFSVDKSIVLSSEDFVFKKVHMKSHTRRSLSAIRARLIGTHGKTRKTMSEISGCDIMIKESEVGIIGEVDDVENVERAIIHLIEGAKQGNMYKFLERMNRSRKESEF